MDDKHAYVSYPSGSTKAERGYCSRCGLHYNHKIHSREDPRPSRAETYMDICHILRKRSTCVRGKVGALLVLESRIIATGYNGAPPGFPHCLDIGCDVDENTHVEGCKRTIHAESNVIAFAAKHGQATSGSTLYSTHSPCLKCAQLLIAAGIAKVVFEKEYRLPEGVKLLSEGSVPMVQYTNGNLETFHPA